MDSAGNVYVTEYHNHRVQKFSSSGAFVTKWGRNGGAGSSGAGDGEFSTPLGIAVDRDGYVYVADRNNHRVQKFTSGGVFVTKWGTKGTADGQFSSPWGVTVDDAGFVYVADTGNNRIQKFSSTGVFVTKWGASGSGDGQFNQPQCLAVDDAGTVFVSDYGNHRVQRFAREGAIPVIVPGGSSAPRDLNGDGKHEDTNGNGRKDFADVVLYFNQMSWIAVNEPVTAFDYNGNGRIDFADVVWLFNSL